MRFFRAPFDPGTLQSAYRARDLLIFFLAQNRFDFIIELSGTVLWCIKNPGTFGIDLNFDDPYDPQMRTF
jgi:hypothetical protein